MAAKANLNEVIQSMQMQNQEIRGFFNRKTGEVELMSRAFYQMFLPGTEEPDFEEVDPEDIEPEDVELVQAIREGKTYLPLPPPREINEDEIMSDFCLTVDDEQTADRLRTHLNGGGAFLRFQEDIQELSLTEDWERFRDWAYRKIARKWADEHGIDYEE